MTVAKARMIGINHVALEVSDVKDALEFYGRIFEFKLRGQKPGMAFIDLGDQFINLSEGRSQDADRKRHFGLVVDDPEAVRSALEGLPVTILDSPGLDFLDPWGNHLQIVSYRDIQFSKTPDVLSGMGLEDMDKSASAMRELRDKGMSPR